MKVGTLRLCALVLISLLVAAPVAAAPPAGMAWDSVTKFAMGADPSTLQPGSFDDDYAAASTIQPAAPTGGGIFGHLAQLKNMAQALPSLLQNGMATKEYVAGSKHRIDMVAMQSAIITDCSARTITTLNLARKTYRVTSMDQPSTSSGGRGSGNTGGPVDNGTSIAIDVTNAALGARSVGGQSTHGYRSQMAMTETKSSGESASQKADIVGYYTDVAMPSAQCPAGSGLSGVSLGQAMAMIQAATRLTHQLAMAGIDKRFKLTQSGPQLPAGNLAMWQAISFDATRGKGATVIVERGNLRPIGPDDPVFSIPADFTRE